MTRRVLLAGGFVGVVAVASSDGQRILRLDKVVMSGGKEMFLYGRR